MPVISAGETSRLVLFFEATLSDSRTIGTWIRRVDDLAEVYRWTDRVTSCHTSLAKLHGPAKVWYDSLLSQQKLVRVEGGVHTCFPHDSWNAEASPGNEDRIYKRGEPIERYCYDKLAKACRCNLSEEACIEYLITDLNNRDTIRAISTRTYDSIEELPSSLKHLEERVGTVGSRDSKYYKASEFENPASHGNKENLAAETALNESKLDQQNSEPRTETPFPEKRRPRCFNCNKCGHLSLNCPSPQRKARCNVCNRSGHEAQNRRKRESGPRLFQSVVDLNMRAADAANEKYFLLTKVNGSKVRVYIDLGSQCVTIRSEDADRVGIKCTVMVKPLTIGGYGSGQR